MTIKDYVENNLHDKVLKKYADEHKASAHRAKAQQLQRYFNWISNHVQRLKSQSKPSFTTAAEEEFIKRLETLGVPFNDLFNYTNKGWSAAGFEFEKDLNKILGPITKGASQQIGAEKAYSGIEFKNSNALQKIPLRALDYYSEELQKWVLYDFTNKSQSIPDGALVRQAGVYGKIDLRVPSTITIQYQESPSVQTFLNLIKGENITAKNYTSMKSIHLGSTKYFRVVSSIMEDLGEAHKKPGILAVYYSTKDNTPHKMHMRFAYELLGAGQYYDINGSLQKLGMTSLLIVYDKTANKINVKSTYDIANQVLRYNKYGGTGASSSINLTQF